MKAHHVELTGENIPDCVRSALAECGQKGGIVRLRAADTYHPSGAGLRGNRAVAVAVDLVTGKRSTVHHGSWGGPNPFGSPARLDVPEPVAIPPGTCIVAGENGYKVSLDVYVHPDSLAPLLPAGGPPELSQTLQRVLDAHCNYNSRGRADHFRDWPVPGGLDAAKAELARLGLLKVSRNGAAKATAAGKNARSDTHWYRRNFEG
jgi:hypothetical protein